MSLLGKSDCTPPASGTSCLNDGTIPDMEVLGSTGSSELTMINSWEVLSFELTPSKDINYIAIGTICPDVLGKRYFHIDDLKMSRKFAEVIAINPSGNICQNNQTLEAIADTPGGEWQWFKSGEALVGETNSLLNVSGNDYGNGEYTARYMLDARCDTMMHSLSGVATDATVDFDVLSQCFDAVDFASTSGFVTDPIVSHSWDFGDGNVSAEEDPSHSYAAPGDYLVALTVSTANGCDIVKNINLTLDEKPEGSFVYTDTCLGSRTGLTAVSNTGIPLTKFEWDLGDGSAENGESILHEYANTGSYTIELIAGNAGDCPSDTIQGEITIIGIPDAAFTSDFTEICEDSCIQFTNTSQSAFMIDQYQWEINGNQFNNENPEICFDNVGQYDARLIITDENGCKDTLKMENYVTVRGKPRATFISSTNKPSEEDASVIFTNKSVDADSWEWELPGNVLNSIDYDISYEFPDTGYYEIGLRVKNEIGCVDYTSGIIYVRPTNNLYVPNSFTPNGDGLNDIFQLEARNLKNIELTILNRWGEVLHTEVSDRPSWNGTNNGVGVKPDVYVWKAKVRYSDETVEEIIGNVTLLR